MKAVLCGMMVLATAVMLGGEEGTEDKPVVKIVASAKGPDGDGKQEVTLKVRITKPWYAYANPVGDPDFAPNATAVTFVGKGVVGEPKIDYPAGKQKIDGKIKYRIYEDGTEIKAVVTRAKGETGPLEAKVSVSICHPKGQCKPEQTVKVTIE